MRVWMAALAAALALWVGSVGAAIAAEPAEVQHGVAPKSARVAGKVVEIDAKGLRLTLDHGEIPAFEMGAMTMAYRVKDAALLEGLRVGESVYFTAVEEPDGDYVITRIEKP